jgi:hypothetical protein
MENLARDNVVTSASDRTEKMRLVQVTMGRVGSCLWSMNGVGGGGRGWRTLLPHSHGHNGPQMSSIIVSPRCPYYRAGIIGKTR